MKTFLILVAIALLLVIALATSRALGAGEPRFSPEDRRELIVAYPGGTFVNEWTYRRCEGGAWVLYLADGGRLYQGRTCWR